jgi:hypothetical protein
VGKNKHPKPSWNIPQSGQSLQPKLDLQSEIKLSFKYIEPGSHYCLSLCNEEQIKIFKQCLKKLSQYSIEQLRGTMSKDPRMRKGLAWELIDNARTRQLRPNNLDASLTIGCVRANDRMRLFLCPRGDTYYVLWFDKDHEICS